MGQCKAKIKSGRRCKRIVAEGEEYCYLHKKADSNKILAIVLGGALVGNLIVPGLGGAIAGGILGALISSQAGRVKDD